MVQPVPDSLDFPQAELAILEFWKSIKAFETSLQLSKGRKRFSFYDGPPFATGLPHYGHLLAGTIKDVVTRWAHQSGHYVERRFGWDCHGLPVEYEIDNKLGIKGPEDVAKMGIEAYNNECRKIVMRYASEWESVVARMGRWIDFKNDYKTMYPWFMESIWWVFKQLYDKGFVYRGFKVMPFSTACHTPLSNFEAGQNYKEVDDPAVFVSFPLLDEPGVAAVAWTTTPWTLPSNLALCVNPNLTYVKILDKERQMKYIIMEARLSSLYRDQDEYTILERFDGSALRGRPYEPLFDYFIDQRERGAFRILTDGYVTEESGTGIVHQAPYHGEDDFRVCLANNIISKDGKIVCPVDNGGRFSDEVPDFKGLHVKEADKGIVQMLKHKGRLLLASQCRHSYPFCWRSDTPLIYKAVPSWFVRVQDIVQKLLANNAKTYWVPDHVKEKRFANWLQDARDWAVSRNRYWGTPIPLWVSSDGEEIVCVGSIEELAKLSGTKLTDLHREVVDRVTIPSKLGKGELRRVPEVFDCWFESGSMPYAQQHYPFEHKKEFDDGFPADFIAEGIDQTRGWFYTLLVLSTALFDKPPFKNLIVNGLVLASDGQKMSKRKKNYPDPAEVVKKYGADALRLYLINSPAVRADNLRFKEDGVRDVLKDVFIPWFNAYRFLIQNIERVRRESNVQFQFNETSWSVSTNYMDRWVLSFTQSLIKFVRLEMERYRLYTVMPRLVKFVEQLTNWYVRMNRKRLKGDSGMADCLASLETLFVVIFSMTKVMAPFVPFITENFYQNLKNVLAASGSKEPDVRSVHFLMLPEVQDELIDEHIEAAVSRMQSIIELGRVIRDRKTLPMKYPLKEVVVVSNDSQCLEDVKSLQGYIMEELNVKKVTATADKEQYCVKLKAEPDHRALGLRLKGDAVPVKEALKNLSEAQLIEFQSTGRLDVLGHTLGPDDLKVAFAFSGAATGRYEVHADAQVLILLDVSEDASSTNEGLAREFINRIQRLRKKAGLQPSDDIHILYSAPDALAAIVSEHYDFIFATIRQPMKRFDAGAVAAGNLIVEENAEIKDYKVQFVIVPRQLDSPLPSPSRPAVPFANVEYDGKVAVVLLQNPSSSGALLSLSQLYDRVRQLFSLDGRGFTIHESSREVSAIATVADLDTKTLKVVEASSQQDATPKNMASDARNANCRYKNIYYADRNEHGTLLLENPSGCNVLSPAQLHSEIKRLFSLGSSQLIKIFSDAEHTKPVEPADACNPQVSAQIVYVKTQ